MFICGKIKPLGNSVGGVVMSKKRIGIVFLSISILLSLSGCGRFAKQEDSSSVDNAENVNIVDTDVSKANNEIIPLKSDNIVADFDSSYDGYEYYLTKEELIADIEQGYIFRLDTAFKKDYAPFVTQGNWSFYVHEENTVNLEVSFSDLLMKTKENIFPIGEQVIVEVISPDEETVYCFEKVGDEITEDTSIQEQIPVTEGEWMLRISFGYCCGNTPACLKIAAVYENPTEDDINWLKEERLANKI